MDEGVLARGLNLNVPGGPVRSRVTLVVPAKGIADRELVTIVSRELEPVEAPTGTVERVGRVTGVVAEFETLPGRLRLLGFLTPVYEAKPPSYP